MSNIENGELFGGIVPKENVTVGGPRVVARLAGGLVISEQEFVVHARTELPRADRGLGHAAQSAVLDPARQEFLDSTRGIIEETVTE